MKSFLTCLTLLSLAVSRGAEALPLQSDYWKDASFLSSFNGSYLPNSRIEPTLSSEERALLVSLQSPLAAGKREQALKLLQDSSLTKKSAPLLFNQANLEFELGKLEEAKSNFEAAIKKFPSFRRAHRNLAFTLVRLDEPETALTHLTRSLSLGDQDPQSLGMLGFLRLQEDQASSALQAYQQAFLLDPENTNWALGVAQSLLRLQRSDEALKIIDEQLTLAPTRIDLHLVKSDILLSLGDESAAASSLAFVHKVGALSLDRRLILGQLMLRRRMIDPATDQLMASFAELVPDQAERAQDAIRTALVVNELELANKLLSQWREKITSPSKAQAERDQMLEARLLIAQGKAEPAKEILVKLSQANPLNGQALILLADLEAKSAPEKALLLLEQASNIDSHSFDAFVAKSRLLVQLRRYQDAALAIKSALKIRQDPELANYLKALEPLLSE
mgnify:CR=1 FL=1